MRTTEVKLKNSEILRLFRSAVVNGAFSQKEIEDIFKTVYLRVERSHPDSTKKCYEYVSRKYTLQLSKELQQQRLHNRRLVDAIY